AALLYLPLAVADPRLGYNLLVLLSFPAPGLATALLAHRYGVPRAAAAVARVVFACAPDRVGAPLRAHPAGRRFARGPVPVWGLEGALAGSWAGGAWCGAALLAVAFMEPHFFYFAALGLPLYLLGRIGLAGWGRGAFRVGVGGGVLVGVLAAAGAVGTIR